MLDARATVCDLVRGCPSREGQMVWDWRVEENIESIELQLEKAKS